MENETKTNIYLIRAGLRLKSRWGGFSNREAVRWGEGGAGRHRKIFPAHLKNFFPMGQGLFRWGGEFITFNLKKKHGKTGFMTVN